MRRSNCRSVRANPRQPMQSSFRPDRESRIRTNGQTGRLNEGHSEPRVPFVPHSTTGLLSGRPSGALFPTPRYDYQLLPGRPSEPLLPDSSLPTTTYCLAAPPSRSFPTPRYATDYQLLSGRPSGALLPDSSLRYRLPATVWPPLRAAPSRLLATDYQLLSGRPSEPLFPTPRYRLPATVWPPLRGALSRLLATLPTTSYCLATPPSRSFPTPRYAADYQLLSGRLSEPLLPDSSLRYRLPATVWPPLRAAPSRLVAAE